ncbi:retrovirus-related pol polyprotein from transposon TNT 1-94, partial [Tanacetum coccineum]
GSGDDAQKKENAKRDAKALFFIQQAVDNSIFSRIAAASTANQAWTILKTEYQGSTKVITVKLQSLRRNFETASMKGNESVQEYLAKVSSIVSQMRSYGEKITDETIVAKVLRSLHPKFDHVVAAIEESKDLSVFSFDELMGSLQAHEARINRNTDKEEEKAFQIRGEPETSNQRLRGRGRSSFRGRGRGRGRNSTLHCTNCNKNGHTEKFCWSKSDEANYAERDEEQEDYLFMVQMKANGSYVADTWYVDNACSHHITGDKSKFKDFDETIRSHVTLGDDKRLSVEGRGTAMVNVVLFDNAKCFIRNKATCEILASSHMTSNRIFPLDFSEDSIMMSKTMSWVYFLQAKSETFEFFKKFKAMAEKQSGNYLKVLKTDRGGEFLSKEFSDFCFEHGIKRELTAPYTPEQNGVAERKNRTVVEMARSMLKSKGLPNSFWAEGVASAVYLLNLSPTKAVWNQTPYEAWLADKSKKFIFVGYCIQSKAYRLYDPTSETIVVSRNVVFDELATWEWEKDNSEHNTYLEEDGTEGPKNWNKIILTHPIALTTQHQQNKILPLLPKNHLRHLLKTTQFSYEKVRGAKFLDVEALAHEEWKNVMEEELQSIEKNQTWEVSDLPEGKTPIGLKWIFKTKYFADGSIQKYKARLVVRGFTQQAGIDYEETFSPVARFEDSKNPNKVLKLGKALYGLKQAPRAWYSKIDEFFHKEGFERSSSLQLISEFKQSMMNTFDMTDLGELHYFLGLNIVQGKSGIFLSQEKYVIDTLEKFNMAGCKTACTPMNIGEKLQHEDGTEAADGTLYRSLIGRLIHLTHSRPDISFSVGLLSRFMHKPSKHHLGAAKRVLRYLAGTKDFGIWFQRTKDFKLKGYTDWAGSVEDRKSTSGSCFILGEAVVSWSSKKQATVALSSTEAEYVAANAAACQAVWMRRILSDMCSEQLGPTEIYCDNKSAVLLARNPVFHNRTKHIEIKHNYIRELLNDGEVALESCRTDEQVADIMTKSLSQMKHEALCKKLVEV